MSFHGETAKEYQDIFDDNIKKGISHIIISAIVLTSKATFASMFRKDMTSFVTKSHIVNENIDNEK